MLAERWIYLRAGASSGGSIAAPGRSGASSITRELEARNISIRSDGKKIVYNSADEIWTADLDGGNRRQETRDRNRDFNPRWIRREGEMEGDLLLQPSGPAGPVGIKPGIRQIRHKLINRGSDEVRIEDCAPDGSMIICRVIRNEANLWTLDPQRMKSDSPLTTSVLSDFAPQLHLVRAWSPSSASRHS